MNSTLEIKNYITSTRFEMVITTSNNKDIMLAGRKEDNYDVATDVVCGVASSLNSFKYAYSI